MVVLEFNCEGGEGVLVISGWEAGVAREFGCACTGGAGVCGQLGGRVFDWLGKLQDFVVR